jgi:hypothetical protein
MPPVTTAATPAKAPPPGFAPPARRHSTVEHSRETQHFPTIRVALQREGALLQR